MNLIIPEVDRMSCIFPKPLKIKEIDGYVGDQTHITSQKREIGLSYLGWLPKINIKEGIKEFINNL